MPGVRVNAVSPGWIASSGMDTYQGEFKDNIPRLKNYCPLGRLGTESEVSAAVCFLLSDAVCLHHRRPRSASMAACRSATARWTLPATDRSEPFNGFHLAVHAESAGRLTMPVIESQVDRNSDEFAGNRERMLAAIAEFREPRRACRRRREKSRDALRQAQAAHAARPHRPAARPRHAVPRVSTARRLSHARRRRRRAPGGGSCRRHRLCRGRALRHHRQRTAPSRAAR